MLQVRAAPLPTHAVLLADVSSVNGEPTAGVLVESRTPILTDIVVAGIPLVCRALLLALELDT